MRNGELDEKFTDDIVFTYVYHNIITTAQEDW